MSIGTNLSLRIAAILLAGFVLMQLLITGLSALPGGREPQRPYNLPYPGEVRTMVAAIERAPADERADVVALFDRSLHHVELRANAVEPGERDADLEQLVTRYRAMLPRHAVAVSGKRSLLRQLTGGRARWARFLAPVTLTVGLGDGRYLAVDSRPSNTLRHYLRGRALVGAVGAGLVLVVLLLAVQRTTRPLAQLGKGVREFSANLHGPDLPEHGPREVRHVAAALNEMKRRIAGLIDERTRILAAIAHDMRTYLTRLRLRSEFIDDPGQRDRAARDLSEMAALLDDTLLLASGGDTGGPAAAPIDLVDAVAALVAERVELGEAVTLEEDAGGSILARRIGVRRILANLIDNGLRHGSRVTVGVAREGDTMMLRVRDDGPGVPEAALARLGEPFARIDPSRDRATGGAGLGLAIVKALAQRDGAEVRFANGTGGGLDVSVRYPRNAAFGPGNRGSAPLLG